MKYHELGKFLMAEKMKSAFVSLNIGLITISDTREISNDKSGEFLSKAIKDANHCLFDRLIIPDNIEKIQEVITKWVGTNSIDVIITSGGTGLTGRDVTPEAVGPLLEKRIDGFSALFHQISSSKIGTSTIQSRALGGVFNNVYIFCLPGSPNACKDAWNEILIHQLDINHKPCNLVEIIPRLSEK